MKYAFFLFTVFLSLNGFSRKSPELGLHGITVISDKLDRSIERGRVIIEGNIKMLSSNLPLDGVEVGTNAVKTITDSEGNFNLNVSADDTVFYCYAEGWSELYQLHPEFIKNRHRVELQCYMSQRRNEMLRKPVIYLYNQSEEVVSVKVKPKGEFTFTYPLVKNGEWHVSANADGVLTDPNNGKNYPYLFWEGETENLFFDFDGVSNTLEGWIIQTDSCISFLEHKLTDLGLNQTEQTDFITFWGPILQHSEYALVQFLVDDAYNTTIAELDIQPVPASLRRVYLLMAPLNNEFVGLDVVPQNLKSFERNGFTVVEWGGTDLNLDRIKL